MKTKRNSNIAHVNKIRKTAQNKGKPTSKPKKIKAWAYVADSSEGKYLITDPHNETTVYLKKPSVIENPFTKKRTWKPTEITIEIHS